MKIGRVGMGAAVGAVLGFVGTFVIINLVKYLWSHAFPYNADTQSFVARLFFLSLIASPAAGIAGGIIGALIIWLMRAPPRVTRQLGWWTLAGVMTISLAYLLMFQAKNRPIVITLAVVGLGCCLLAGIPWAHLRGHRKLKAAFLGWFGFVVGGAVGALLGSALFYALQRPQKDSMEQLGWITVGLWVGGLLLAFAAIRWVIWFHRRYAAELFASGQLPGSVC